MFNKIIKDETRYHIADLSVVRKGSKINNQIKRLFNFGDTIQLGYTIVPKADQMLPGYLLYLNGQLVTYGEMDNYYLSRSQPYIVIDDIKYAVIQPTFINKLLETTGADQ